jgi:hypothetical protein
MRCPQCGFDVVAGAAFCSRCGTRLFTPRPADKHEYALTRILPSWWHFARRLALAILLLCAAIPTLYSGHQGAGWLGALLIVAALVVFGTTAMARRAMNWSVTSERLIERRGLLATRRRELELADIRSALDAADFRAGQRSGGIGSKQRCSYQARGRCGSRDGRRNCSPSPGQAAGLSGTTGGGQSDE